MTNVHSLLNSEDRSETTRGFDQHVPFSDTTSLVLKAHLIIECALLKFIEARVPAAVYTDISSSKFSYYQRSVLAHALSHHDMQPVEGNEIIWPALQKIGTLRNLLVHNLNHEGISIADKMKTFVECIFYDRNIWSIEQKSNNINWMFRAAAEHLHFLLTLSKEPLRFSDIDFDSPLEVTAGD